MFSKVFTVFSDVGATVDVDVVVVVVVVVDVAFVEQL